MCSHRHCPQHDSQVLRKIHASRVVCLFVATCELQQTAHWTEIEETSSAWLMLCAKWGKKYYLWQRSNIHILFISHSSGWMYFPCHFKLQVFIQSILISKLKPVKFPHAFFLFQHLSPVSPDVPSSHQCSFYLMDTPEAFVQVLHGSGNHGVRKMLFVCINIDMYKYMYKCTNKYIYI